MILFLLKDYSLTFYINMTIILLLLLVNRKGLLLLAYTTKPRSLIYLLMLQYFRQVARNTCSVIK